MNKLFFSILIVIVVVGCQNKSTISDSGLSESLDKYQKSGSPEDAKEYAGKVVEYLIINPEGPDKKSALINGVKVSDEKGLLGAKISFLSTLVKSYPRDKENGDRVFDLAATMEKAGKPKAANALYYSFLEKYRNHEKVAEAKKSLSADIKDIDGYLKQIGASVFENPDKFGINRNNAQAYVDACEAYAMVNPESVATPEFLYKASEIARTLKTFPKALSLYDWIIESYPEYEKAPTSLFLKGFILENDLNDIKRAEEAYRSFIAKYPNHQLADDVSFLIENLGKSDDEIMEMITKKKDS